MSSLLLRFLSQHNSHKFIGMILKLLRVCDRNMLPWILEHRHTAQFLNCSRLRNLVEQSHVITHVADHCQYGRRWRMTLVSFCGNLDQRDMERLNRRCHGKRGAREHNCLIDLWRSTAIICASFGLFCMRLEVFLGLSVMFGSMAHRSPAVT